MSLYQIVYKSYAKPGFDTSEISQILEKSHKNNPKANITGMLLYKDGVFLQIIEGDERELHFLYNKISRDDSHEKVKLLWEQVVHERTFDNWSMAFKDLSQIPAEVEESFGDQINQAFEEDLLNPSMGLTLFAGMRNSL